MRISVTVASALTFAFIGPSVNGLAVDLLLEEAGVDGKVILQ